MRLFNLADGATLPIIVNPRPKHSEFFCYCKPFGSAYFLKNNLKNQLKYKNRRLIYGNGKRKKRRKLTLQEQIRREINKQERIKRWRRKVRTGE